MTSFLNSRKRVAFFVTGVSGVLIGGGIAIFFLLREGNEESNLSTDENSPLTAPTHYSESLDSSFFESSEVNQGPKMNVNQMRKKVINSCEEARNTLDRALEQKNVEMSKLEELFAVVRKLCPPAETPDNATEYATRLYEAIKREEAQKPLPQRVRKLKRLRNRVKKLNPTYVDQPTLEESVGSKLVEHLDVLLTKPAEKVKKESLTDAFRGAKVLGTPADHPALAFETVKEYLEDRVRTDSETLRTNTTDQAAQQSLRQNSALLVNVVSPEPVPQAPADNRDGQVTTPNNSSSGSSQQSIVEAPESELPPEVVEEEEMNAIIFNNADPAAMPKKRGAVSERAQKELDQRNVELKKLCDMKSVVPGEAKKDFDDWKATGFKTESSPKFVELLQKVQTNEQRKQIVTQSLMFHAKQQKCAKEVYKHRKDQKEVLNAKKNEIVSTFLHFMLKDDLELTPQILNWLKADDFDKIQTFIDSIYLNSSGQVTKFLEGLISLDLQWKAPEKGYFQATSAYYEIKNLKWQLQKRGMREPQDLAEYWSVCESKWQSSTGNEYEYWNYQLAQKRAGYENAENNFKGTNKTVETEKFRNIYEPVHIKLAALLFMKIFREKDNSFIVRKASELGLTSVMKVEDIEEKDWAKFEGHYKAYDQIVLYNISSRIETADFPEIRELAAKYAAEYKRAKEEMAALDEAMSLVSKIREGRCSLNMTGQVECKSKILQARYRHPQWLGKDAFKPTQPYHNYFNDLDKKRLEMHAKFKRLETVDMFFSDPYFVNIKLEFFD